MNQDIRRFQFNGEDALLLPARREAFTTLKEWLNSIAEELELPVKTRKQLLIAADEIFTNIASYGYPSGDGTAKVVVEFDMAQAELTLIFSDTGGRRPRHLHGEKDHGLRGVPPGGQPQHSGAEKAASAGRMRG